MPDRPGTYDVRVSVRGALRRPSGGPGARDATASSGSQPLTDASNDTTTVTVMPDIRPVGIRLDTLVVGRDDSILLGGSELSGTTVAETRINYAVIDRQTLRVAQSGSVDASLAGMRDLAAIVDGYTGALKYLVVLNWSHFGGDINADRDAFDALLQKIGAQRLTRGQRQEITADTPSAPTESGSAVGVVGAPAGSAYVKFSGPNIRRELGGMSGYLRLNGVTGEYDFVFADAVDFDTEANQTSTDASPAQLTVKVGDATYTQPNPGDGVSGFHLVVLRASTLSEIRNSVYATNTANGTEQTDEVERLAGDLVYAAFNDTRPLVILQAFGAPHGNDALWELVARMVERLGGTRQVFNAMNAVDPQTLNGEDPNRKGPYVFVGRVGSTAPLAEASHSLNGDWARLRGLLMRGHDGGYEPTLAGPPLSNGESPVNTQLIQIADQVTEPFPAFKDTNGDPIDAASAQAVQKFLGGPDVTRLCAETVPVCDIRESYYQDYDADWVAIAGILADAGDKCAQPPLGAGFNRAQCNGIRQELRDEMFEVARVQKYFGPLGLQQPFGATGVAGLANVTEIAQQIKDAVRLPPVDNTTSNNLSMISQILFPTPTTPNPGAFAALSAAFSLAAYFTKQNASPNLIGPQVTTAASKLGVELADRYQQAGDNLDDVGRLIVSDYGKLSAVASRVDAKPGPGERDWRLGNVGQAREGLVLAARRTIYERLVPVAYPVMYDIGQINARDWKCDGGHFGPVPLPDKHLFAGQTDDSQFIGRFSNWTTTIAVAEAHAVEHGADARIPGIDPSITDVLFKPTDQGGLGLNKLQFYSPANGFRYLPASPAVPVLHDSTNDDLDSLYEYPYNRENLGFQVLFCSDMPDPPGNSGP